MIKSNGTRTNLVLSRKAGESIDLGNDIRITVDKIRGNKVSISIQSPKELTILRTELVHNAVVAKMKAELGAEAKGLGLESKGRI
jgi:carbon storage regulator